MNTGAEHLGLRSRVTLWVQGAVNAGAEKWEKVYLRLFPQTTLAWEGFLISECAFVWGPRAGIIRFVFLDPSFLDFQV